MPRMVKASEKDSILWDRKNRLSYKLFVEPVLLIYFIIDIGLEEKQNRFQKD